MFSASPVLYCQSNDRFLFLDLVRDRYFCLPRNLELLFHRHSEHDILAPNEIEMLKAGGVLTAQTVPEAQRHSLCARSSVFEIRLPEPNPADVIKAIGEQILWGFWLRQTGLHGVLTKLQRKKSKIPADARQSTARALRLAQAARRSERWIASETQCLRRSLALLDALLREDQHGDLIIGVKSKPFGAHAWVQFDGQVLNDTVDETLRFTPILVV